MTAWPGSLPWFLLSDFSDTPEDGVLRTEMDAGPRKMRVRWQVEDRVVSGSMLVTGTQRATLEAFYKTTLLRVLPFTHEDPDTGSSANFRFVVRPTYTPEVAHDDHTLRVWRVRTALEILP